MDARGKVAPGQPHGVTGPSTSAAAATELEQVLITPSSPSLPTAPTLSPGPEEPPVDERSSLLGRAWDRSDRPTSATPASAQTPAVSSGGSGSRAPPGPSSNGFRLTASAASTAAGVRNPPFGRTSASGTAATAFGRGGSGVASSLSPFETMAPATALQPGGGSGPGLMSPGGRSGGSGVPVGRGGSTTRAGPERQASTLLRASTLAGDLHTAVPAFHAPGAGSIPSQASGASATAGAGGGGGGAGGGASAGAGAGKAVVTGVAAGAAAGGAMGRRGSGKFGGRAGAGGGGGGCKEGIEDEGDQETVAQLNEYLRDEQLRHAADTRLWLKVVTRATLKRSLMALITGFGLGAAIYFSKTTWGTAERAGLPRWRWFLIVGCLPPVWYIPWFSIFLVVLLLESLLPVSAPVRAGEGAGPAPGSPEERRGDPAGGPAMVIYHILGVRRHMVRILRSVCGQLLAHFVVVDYLDPEYKSSEGTAMKAWTCVTLFLLANCLKAFTAKALSKHFHSRGYLQRMQESVKQELVLMALSRPCPGRTASDALTHLGLGYHLANIFGYNSGPHMGHSKSAGGLLGGGGCATGGGAGELGGGGAGRGGGSHGGAKPVSRVALASPFAGPAGAAALRDVQSMPPNAAAAVRAAEAAVNSAAAAAASQQAGRRSHERANPHAHSTGDLLALGSKGADGSVHGGSRADGSVRGGTAGLGGGWGSSASAGMGQGGRRPSRELGRQAAVGGRGRGRPHSWSDLLRLFRQHFHKTYAKTKVQWDLSRPSNGSVDGGNAAVDAANAAANAVSPGVGGPVGMGATGGGPGGAAGGGRLGPGIGAAGGGGGPGRLDFSQLRTSLFWLEQHIRRNKLRMGVTLSDQLRAAAEDGEAVKEVTSKTEAKRLAFYIHMNVLGLSDLRGRKYIVARDFEHFFGTAQEVREAFAVFDHDGDGRITLQNMVDTVVRIYKERKKLALTLQDTRTVVAKLELICGVVLHVLFAFVYLIIFQVNVRELWLTFSSVTLAFVFVFGNSIRSIYEAVLFLFVVHPFDVGDYVLLANGDMVKVEEIALLFCTFLKGDGRRLYYPNTKLMGEAIVNVSRSDTYWDSAQLLVDIATPGSALEAAETRLKRWLADNPKQFTGSAGVLARTLTNPAKLQLSVFWEYCHPGEDAGRTGRWRSKAMLVLAGALDSLHVSYTLPAMKDTRPTREVAAAVGLLADDGTGVTASARLAAEAAGAGGGNGAVTVGATLGAMGVQL
ncbi:hypothetical protein CHLRE_12g505800v5 [Chlamydomonas reinhardtii]|uniref:EF-hand domain-containing protein n=1 Tax=Chlamydomonas reinhardtii TaxID=3055 RepID=A0A2K3D2Y5_CHLRE|nr:uncharacterized protein CHLRE_12g505800v5 [Chlamydomonas reinhardtii]PNW74891.1 hypothetical protein CHLRE_12g505800v5 [Chlamydomonas reinhardtii]